jgi:hypothetical protein
MNVHITCTPEFHLTVLNEVVDILNQTKGFFEFRLLEPASIEDLSYFNPKFKNSETIKELTFDEFFYLCKSYRINRVSPEDYLVLVTSIKNEKDWFSAFKSKDIFIYGLEWEYYTKHDDKFGIAYQILENIFQSQIELKINDIDNEPNIHVPSIGCISDMCLDKVDVMLKLRTADICESCITRAEEKNVNPLILEHIMTSIESLRKVFVNSNRIKTKIKPLPVYIDPKRNVKIGDNDVHIIALQRVLIIFFLKNPQGVKTKLIAEYQDDLYDVYKEIRHSGEKFRIKNMFENSKGGDPSFKSIKAKLNKDLYKKLGPLADYYIITKVEVKDDINIYKINLEKEYITIAPSR